MACPGPLFPSTLPKGAPSDRWQNLRLPGFHLMWTLLGVKDMPKSPTFGVFVSMPSVNLPYVSVSFATHHLPNLVSIAGSSSVPFSATRIFDHVSNDFLIDRNLSTAIPVGCPSPPLWMPISAIAQVCLRHYLLPESFVEPCGRATQLIQYCTVFLTTQLTSCIDLYTF